MTDDERMACIEAWSLGSWGDRLGEIVRICIAVEKAGWQASTLAERERAAKVCEGMVRMDRHGYPDYPSSYAEQCAAAIRSTK